jgi:hypothetical protein
MLIPEVPSDIYAAIALCDGDILGLGISPRVIVVHPNKGLGNDLIKSGIGEYEQRCSHARVPHEVIVCPIAHSYDVIGPGHQCKSVAHHVVPAIIVIARHRVHIHALLEDSARGNFRYEAVSVLVRELSWVPACPLEVGASDILHAVAFPDFHVSNFVLLVVQIPVVCICHIELILAAILISDLKLPTGASHVRLIKSLLPRGPFREIVLILGNVGLLQVLEVELLTLKVQDTFFYNCRLGLSLIVTLVEAGGVCCGRDEKKRKTQPS